jgi:Spy/CpxP family protein refolding chaperone
LALALNFCTNKQSIIQKIANMKIPLIVLVLSLGTLSSSAQIERKPAVIKTDSAQAVKPGNKTYQQSRKDRLKDLDLTREQKMKLKEIREANKTAKDAIENNTQLSEQDKKKQLRALQKEQAQKVQAILTDEQRAKFKASKPNDS